MKTVFRWILCPLLALFVLFYVLGNLLFPNVEGGLEKFVQAAGPDVIRAWAESKIEEYRQDPESREGNIAYKNIASPAFCRTIDQYAPVVISNIAVYSEGGKKYYVGIRLGSPIWESHAICIGKESDLSMHYYRRARKLADGIWYGYEGGK